MKAKQRDTKGSRAKQSHTSCPKPKPSRIFDNVKKGGFASLPRTAGHRIPARKAKAKAKTRAKAKAKAKAKVQTKARAKAKTKAQRPKAKAKAEAKDLKRRQSKAKERK